MYRITRQGVNYLIVYLFLYSLAFCASIAAAFYPLERFIVPQFHVVYITCIFLCYLFSGYMLFTLSKIRPRPSYAIVGGAQLFIGLACILYVCFSLGAYYNFIKITIEFEWLWVCDRIMYPFMLILALRVENKTPNWLMNNFNRKAKFILLALIFIPALVWILSYHYNTFATWLLTIEQAYSHQFYFLLSLVYLAISLYIVVWMEKGTQLYMFLALSTLFASMGIVISPSFYAVNYWTWYLSRFFDVAGALCLPLYITKQAVMIFEDMHHRNQVLVVENETDPMTNLLNKQAFYHKANIILSQMRHGSAPLSILVLDIDHFKQFNDTFGHLSGDECIRQVASIINGNTRSGVDLCARFGGEEFLALLPNAGGDIAQRISTGILNGMMRVHSENSDELWQVSISIGALTVNSLGDETLLSLIEQADQLLYQAKESGRRRVVSLVKV